MKPNTFPQAYKTLTAPEGVKNVKDLPIFSDGIQCVSRWKPTFAERIRLIFGASVWLGVMAGKTQPPVWLGAENPFEAEKPATKLQMAWLDIKDFITDTWALVKHGFSQADKRKHFTIGMAIAFVCSLAWMLIGLPLPGLFAFLVGACAGIVKEWWDSKGHGTVEVMDFVFTAMGLFLAMIAIVVINLII